MPLWLLVLCCQRQQIPVESTRAYWSQNQLMQIFSAQDRTLYTDSQRRIKDVHLFIFKVLSEHLKSVFVFIPGWYMEPWLMPTYRSPTKPLLWWLLCFVVIKSLMLFVIDLWSFAAKVWRQSPVWSIYPVSDHDILPWFSHSGLKWKVMYFIYTGEYKYKMRAALILKDRL